MKRLYHLLAVLTLFAVVLGAVRIGAAAAPTPDRAPRIAILGAYAPEWSYLLADIQHPRTVDINGMERDAVPLPIYRRAAQLARPVGVIS